jgi:long-chain acyl-CoA synthetase
VPVCVKGGKDFVEKEEFKKLIEQEVQAVNKELESYEQIKKYYIVDYKFTEDSGELTPTLKVKRRIVMDKFKKEIDGLYR